MFNLLLGPLLSFILTAVIGGLVSSLVFGPHIAAYLIGASLGGIYSLLELTALNNGR